MTHRQHGFSIIEMLTVIAIVAIMAAMAAPSFIEFRDRAALRAAAGGVKDLVELARFESIQRDRPVTVAFAWDSASVWCVGAVEGAAACDCRELDPAEADFCALDRFPAFNLAGADVATQAPELLRRIELFENPAFGTGTPAATSFTFDPKLGVLTDITRAGRLGVTVPVTGSRPYRMRVAVSPLGSVIQCSVEYNGYVMGGYPQC